MKKTAFLLLCCLFTCLFTYGQAPFTGGKGDGYASVSLRSPATGVDSVTPAEWQVYPQPLQAGEKIQIEVPHTYVNVEMTVECWNMHGQKLYQGEVLTSKMAISTTGWPGSTYLLLIKKDGIVRGQKLIALF